jgi:hypothetical protein
MDPDLCNGLIIPLHQSFGIISKSEIHVNRSDNDFIKILETLILDFLESNNILGETQGAFLKDRRIEDQIFSLQGIASLYKSSRKPLYLAFLDLSKAFDRVWRDGLFALLWENGIKEKCWRLLRKMYEKVENKVIFGDFELTSSASKRQFINFDEIFAPILLFSSMFAKSVIKIEKRVGTNAALF